jgi:hypothetical protein
MRTTGGVLPGNLLKIHSQDLSFFLYTSKYCFSRSNYRLCLFVLERPCLFLLKHPVLSLLDLGLLSLKLLLLSLINNLFFRGARALVVIVVLFWGRVHVVLI